MDFNCNIFLPSKVQEKRYKTKRTHAVTVNSTRLVQQVRLPRHLPDNFFIHCYFFPCAHEIYVRCFLQNNLSGLPICTLMCAPILLAQTHMYAGIRTKCIEAMIWPDHLDTACSGSAVHFIPPPTFIIHSLW